MCFTVQLSKIIVISPSHRQLWYSIMLFSTCQELFLLFSNPFKSFLFRILSCFVFLRRNSDIISSVFWFVNKFFQIFWFFQTSTFSGISWIPAVPRQLPKTALLDYHGASFLSTLISSFLSLFQPSCTCFARYCLFRQPFGLDKKIEDNKIEAYEILILSAWFQKKNIIFSTKVPKYLSTAIC